MKRTRRVVLAVLSLAGLAATAPAAGGTLVELFTSQSCYSCPPAEALLGELAGRRDVVALEFHVDYWDRLVHGAAGAWKDPYSSPEATLRQRLYNAAIRGTGNVYTPQMVIDGTFEVVGSQRTAVLGAIERAARAERARVGVALTPSADRGLSVTLRGTPGDGATLWLAVFDKAKTTVVRAGENQGKTLTNHHIVSALRPLGPVTGASMTIADPGLAPGQGCAVIVQSATLRPVLGAAYCPGS